MNGWMKQTGDIVFESWERKSPLYFGMPLTALGRSQQACFYTGSGSRSRPLLLDPDGGWKNVAGGEAGEKAFLKRTKQ